MLKFNYLGLWTLYCKEVQRFFKVFFQTIIAPVISSLLFMAVFALAMGGADMPAIKGMAFTSFLAPGLIMMAMVQNAFANTSSSLMMGKMQGCIIDVLMPPLSPWELTLGFALGGITRGLLVGISVSLALAYWTGFAFHSLFFIVFHAVAASLMLALLGMLGGIWADKFDHLAAVTNFVVTPLSFLSGTFYSIDRLPEFFRALALINPFFYMIDGFRYGVIGYHDADLGHGVFALVLCNGFLLLAGYWLFKSGYKLKS